MGMTCDLFAIPAADAEHLLAHPGGVHDLLGQLDGTAAHLPLEKSWGGLHFALTGTAFGGEPPLNLLIAPGQPVGTEDVGYGPARLFDPPTVAAFAAALGRFSDADFDRNFVPERMAADGTIYPDIWDEPVDELRAEYLAYLRPLRAHAARAAAAGHALVVALR